MTRWEFAWARWMRPTSAPETIRIIPSLSPPILEGDDGKRESDYQLWADASYQPCTDSMS